MIRLVLRLFMEGFSGVSGVELFLRSEATLSSQAELKRIIRFLLRVGSSNPWHCGLEDSSGWEK